MAALVALSLALPGCVVGRRPPVTPTGPIYATSIPAASPTALSPDTPRPALPDGPCTNDAQFVADVTIPDGTLVEPGAPLDKRWRVRNSGTCDWGPGYTLELISGPSMGAEPVSGLYPARAGAEVEIQLLMRAPQQPGEYTNTWQMRDAQAQPFGDVLFMTIVVAQAP